MKIFNTLTRQKEEFVPIAPGEAKIYACGPTVYNFIHIGNARPMCVFDILRRYLEYRGMKVTFVQNFTDIDDKIIRKANEEKTDYLTVAERYIQEYETDARGLNIREATVHPRATETMEQIIEIISDLVKKGYAYPAENGDVYFRTLKVQRVWKAFPSAAGGAGGRRPHRGWREQGRPDGFRPLESGQARRAVLGFPMGKGAAGLAYRMFRHGQNLFGRYHRYPLRRSGFDFSPSRK